MYRVGGSTGVFGRLKTVPPDAFHSTDFQTVEGAMDASRGDYYRVRRAYLVEGMSVRRLLGCSTRTSSQCRSSRCVQDRGDTRAQS